MSLRWHDGNRENASPASNEKFKVGDQDEQSKTGTLNKCLYEVHRVTSGGPGLTALDTSSVEMQDLSSTEEAQVMQPSE